MKIIDALNILSISSVEITLKEVKTAYRKASKAYHPDINPAGLTTMQFVNEAYETLLSATFPLTIGKYDQFSDYGEEINKALNSINSLVELKIEVCGSWLWISGNTRPYKSILKENGFKYSGQKKMWYFRPDSSSKKFYRSSTPIDEIRVKYGAETIKPNYRTALT